MAILKRRHAALVRRTIVVTLLAAARLAAQSRPVVEDDIKTGESQAFQSAGGHSALPGDLNGVRMLLGTLFGAVGAQVHQASSVSEALRLANEIVPDVLVSDIAMPGEDGTCC